MELKEVVFLFVHTHKFSLWNTEKKHVSIVMEIHLFLALMEEVVFQNVALMNMKYFLNMDILTAKFVLQ